LRVHRPIWLAAGCASLCLFAACSPDPKDFKSEGQDYIEGGLRDEFPAGFFTADGRFTDADCDQPTSTSIGTRFDCRAVTPDGQAVIIPIEITGKREITVDASSIQSAD
jgi:hypothetical protein